MFNKSKLLIIALSLIVFTLIPLSTQAKEAKSIRLVQVSDTHIDSSQSYISFSRRLLAESASLLGDIINQINLIPNVDLVVFSGDLVNEPKKVYLDTFLEKANKLKPNWYFCFGNHDADIEDFDEYDDQGKHDNKLSKKYFLQLIKEKNKNIISNQTFYSVQVKDKFLFVFLDGAFDETVKSRGVFPKEELEWLDNLLKNNTDKKVIMVQHFPVVQPIDSWHHKVVNDDKYFEVIDKYKNIIAVLSGHYHISKITIRNNVAHISCPALIEYPNAYRVIDITDENNKVVIDVKTKISSLKELREKSKSLSNNWELSRGQYSDRYQKIYLKY